MMCPSSYHGLCAPTRPQPCSCFSLPGIVSLEPNRAAPLPSRNAQLTTSLAHPKRNAGRAAGFDHGRNKRSRETLHFSFISEDRIDRKPVLPSRVFTHRSSPPSYSKRMGPLRMNGKKRGQHHANKLGKAEPPNLQAQGLSNRPIRKATSCWKSLLDKSEVSFGRFVAGEESARTLVCFLFVLLP